MISIEQKGRRYYLTGDTYAHRDDLREFGAHWDASTRAWWTAKGDEAKGLISRLNKQGEQAPTKQPAGDGENAIVAAAADYKGRPYYVIGRVIRGRTHWDDRVVMVTAGEKVIGDAIDSRDPRAAGRVLLSFRDGSKTFWADLGAIQITKRYQKPQSIGGLKRYRAKLANGEVPVCRYCGSPSCDGARGGHCEED